MTTPKDGVPASDSATTPPAADIGRMVAVLREAREALMEVDRGCDRALIDRIDAVLPKGTE